MTPFRASFTATPIVSWGRGQRAGCGGGGVAAATGSVRDGRGPQAGAWLYRVAYNLAIDQHCRARREGVSLEPDWSRPMRRQGAIGSGLERGICSSGSARRSNG